MPDNNFVENARRGKIGEKFVIDHIKSLCASLMLNQEEHAGDYIEGGDLRTHMLRVGQEINSFLPDYVDMPELQEGTWYEVCGYTIGGVEVKTTWDFLAKTYDHEECTGTLPFALWSSSSREHPGWLLKMLHPERYTHPGETLNAVQPHALLYILAAYENVFASIAFENIPMLLNRLRGLANAANVDLDDSIPLGQQAQTWAPDNILISGNMWLIPLINLQDLATVTLIGEKPRIRPDIFFQNRSCTSHIQESRYDHLSRLAGNKHIPIEEEYRNSFTPSRNRKVFADISYNLSILDSFDETVYPTLAIYRRKKVFEHLRGLMLYMLAQESPVWPLQNKRFFLIGKLTLEDWCKGHGISGSTKSWQGSLIFLADCGLIKCFRPIGNNQEQGLETIYRNLTPVNGKYPTLRSVPRYTDDVLLHAEHIAKLYHEREIILSKMTKADVILCRGNDRANQLYLDGRGISEEEMYVRELYQRILIHRINENGYAEKDNVLKTVRQTMRREMGFQWIDPTHTLNEAERDEMDRQKKYWDAYSKIKERTRQLANDAGYEYHPIRNNNRTEFGLLETYSKWIIS